MHTGRIVFAQVMDFFPYRRFGTCVGRYAGDRHVRSFPCRDQLLCMLFAQLTYRESLRDIESCLRGLHPKLFHVGIRSPVSRSTLADANETRDWRIYADIAQILIQRAQTLYADEDLGMDLDATVYALDATTIDLCLSLFPWANFRATKAAIKLHVLLNLRGNIPEFIHISDARTHEVNVLDLLVPLPGAFYLIDRGYLDFQRLCELDTAGAFFVTRAKKNFNFRRRYSHPVDRSTGFICDQTIMLTSHYPAKKYPKPLRRIRYYDAESGETLVFLTNNFELDTATIAKLYKARWQVELFFKWIKQHLRIKAFYGTSANAVRTQIWIAVCAYLLVAIMKKELHIDQTLYTILQVLSVSLFEKIPIMELFAKPMSTLESIESQKQLYLFDF
jgi:transposase